MEVDVGEICKQQQPPAGCHVHQTQEMPAAVATGVAPYGADASAAAVSRKCSVVLPAALQDLSQQLTGLGPQQPEQLQQVLRNAGQQLLLNARQEQKGAHQ
jgi:hypothetical protein